VDVEHGTVVFAELNAPFTSGGGWYGATVLDNPIPGRRFGCIRAELGWYPRELVVAPGIDNREFGGPFKLLVG